MNNVVAAPTGAARRRHGGWAFAVLVTALDVGLAVAAFSVARGAGADQAVSYLVGGVGPVFGAAVVWWRARTLSGASVAIFAFTVLSCVAALVGSRDARVLLYKDAVVTGLVGSIFAVSMLFGRPLAFYFGQRFATDGTPEGIRAWNAMWQYPLFRRAQYVVSSVWAVTYLVEAVAKAWLIRRSGFDSAYTTSQVLPFAAAGVAVVLTVVVARHYHHVADRESDADDAHVDGQPAAIP